MPRRPLWPAGSSFLVQHGGDSAAAEHRHQFRRPDARRVAQHRRWRQLGIGHRLHVHRRSLDSARRQLLGVRTGRRAGQPDPAGRRQHLQGLSVRSLHRQRIELDQPARRAAVARAVRGLSTIGAVDKVYDGSGSLGGPLRQNKLWFFTAHRWWGNSQFVPGLFYNKDASAWIYEPDLERPAVNDSTNRHHTGRLTWQAAEKHRFNVSWDLEQNCVCHTGLTGNFAPEGVHRWNFGPPNYIIQATWSHPLTNKLLLEAGNTSLIFDYPTIPSEDLPLGVDQISVLEQSRNFRYRSAAGGWRYGHKISKQSN
jgi:hypothetical protein